MCSKDEDGNGNSSSALSRVSILVGFICALSYFVAFVNNGWVYTKESYRVTNLNLYASVTFKIGLWKTCHSFQRINSTIILPPPGCTVISYFNWSEVTLHGLGINLDAEPTLNILTRIRWCTVFVGFGFVLLLIGFIYSVIGHFYQDNKTLLASAIYTLSGLSMAAGLFVFVCVLTDSFAGMSYASEAPSWSVYDLRRSRDYKYGWCFLLAAVACIFVEMVAVLCITVHYRRCQTIAFVFKNMRPLVEEKTTTMSQTYYATKETGLLMRADDEKAKADSKSSSCDEASHAVPSETPPDICSTFLSAEQSDAEPEERTAASKEVADAAAHSSHKGKRANFATLNTRNYRCHNYPTVRKYSTLGGCNLLAMECGAGATTPSGALGQAHCHQKTCFQSTMPRLKAACATNKYHTTDRQAKISEMQQLSCDDFNL